MIVKLVFNLFLYRSKLKMCLFDDLLIIGVVWSWCCFSNGFLKVEIIRNMYIVVFKI